jgi:hypothetical protein
VSNVELDSPEAATVVTFSAVDGVGRLRLESGEELRFGASAWKEGGPSVGAAVFVTAVGPHPLGGRRVHYAERFAGKGYEDALFPVARQQPTAHFVWMLARLAHPGEARAEEALAILRSYLTDPQTPAELRDQVETFLQSRDSPRGL